MKKRKRNPTVEDRQPVLVGAAWYRANQWQRLKEVSEDRANLEDTWEEWVQIAEKGLCDARAMGVQVVKVDVDLDELLQWCQSRQQPVNADSRSAFAAENLQRQNTK